MNNLQEVIDRVKNNSATVDDLRILANAYIASVEPVVPQATNSEPSAELVEPESGEETIAAEDASETQE